MQQRPLRFKLNEHLVGCILCAQWVLLAQVQISVVLRHVSS